MQRTLSCNINDVNAAYDNYIKSPTTSNYELIFSCADRLINKYAKNYGMLNDFYDLQQTGYLGLIKAIDSFNPGIGVKFSTWASNCILSEIRHDIRKYQKFFNINYPQSEESSKNLNGLLSLTSSDGQSILENEGDLKAEDATKEHLDLKILIEKLSPLDKKIVELLFYKDYSQDEVASILGISQKKVSRQKAKIINSLQNEFANSSFTLIDNSMSFKLVK